MIDKEMMALHKQNRLEKLVSALEDQDFILQIVIDEMPMCEEKKDLVEVKNLLINLLGEIDGMFSV